MAYAMLIFSRQARPARLLTSRFAAPFRIAPLLGALALCACSTASYPSLAQRPGETTPHPAPQTAPTSPASVPTPQLAAWLADAQTAHARFTAALPAARAALAAAQSAPRGSEAWSTANLALAQLETLRTDLGITQAALESSYAQDRLALTHSPSAPQIAATRDAITTLTTAEDEILAALRRQLPA